jgi:hypothetical protein
VCYYAGIEFDRLLKAGKIVGLEQSVNPTTYKRIPKEDMEIEFTHDDEDNISTLGSIHDRIQDAATPNSQLIELPQLVRL